MARTSSSRRGISGSSSIRVRMTCCKVKREPCSFGRRATYRLGPPPERNVFLDAVDNLSFGSQYLRGYDAETVQGDRYVLATAAYRLPLLDIFGGLETVPLFLGRFKLALFTDWAQAAKEPLDWRPSKFYRAVGAELVTEATVGWRLPMRVRMGWAKGLDEEGTSQVYFYLGNWF